MKAHTFTVRSPKSRLITINAPADVVWEKIIQPRQACRLFNGDLTETKTQLPWEGFWLSYQEASWGVEENSGEFYQVPVKIIANEATGRIEFHRYPEIRLYRVGGPLAFLSAQNNVRSVVSPVHRIRLHDESPVDRIVAVELRPSHNGCQMRIQGFNVYRLLPSSIVSWPVHVLSGIVLSPFRILGLLATRLGLFNDNIQIIKRQIESKVSKI